MNNLSRFLVCSVFAAMPLMVSAQGKTQDWRMQ